MRVFKHGDVLAIVFPQSVAYSSELREGEELDFVEVEKGVFVLLRKEKTAELARQKLAKLNSALDPFEKQTPPQAQQAPTPSSTDSGQASSLSSFFKRELDTKGFVVVFAEKGAQQVSTDLQTEIKKGDVVGARGFDKKFYVAKREFVESQSGKLFRAFKEGPLSLSQLVEKTKIPEDGVKAVLCILMEEGEVIEKKKGLFASA